MIDFYHIQSIIDSINRHRRRPRCQASNYDDRNGMPVALVVVVVLLAKRYGAFTIRDRDNFRKLVPSFSFSQRTKIREQFRQPNRKDLHR